MTLPKFAGLLQVTGGLLEKLRPPHLQGLFALIDNQMKEACRNGSDQVSSRFVGRIDKQMVNGR
jgi:hypothetical protein